MVKFRFLKLIGFVFLSLVMFSCDNELQVYLPEGPQGPQGLSAYDVWVNEVNNGNIAWDKDRTDKDNFFLYLKGADGKDGVNGTNGKSAYDIWKEEVAKGIEDPHNLGTLWSKDKTTLQDFWYYLTGAKGQDGGTPTIGDNGNWFINGNDTGIPARGKDGQNGQDGTSSVVTIGQNGNWYIDGVDTKVPAFGKDGTNGTNGKSAYELWVEEVAKGLENPHDPGNEWPKGETTVQDFWKYLRGADGDNGKDGEFVVGEPGKDITIVKGKPNVISQYSLQEYGEFVRWSDGGVLFIVYDDQGSVSPGAKVVGLPGVMDPNKEYTADENGQFIVPKEDLSYDKPITERFGSTPKVTYLKSTGETVTEASAPNTYVPNRMQIRIRIGSNNLWLSGGDYTSGYVYIERKTDPGTDWTYIPSYLGDLVQSLIPYELSNANDPTSYTASSLKYKNSNRSINIGSTSSLSSNYFYVYRLVKDSKFQDSGELKWDNVDHYYNLVLESYYGEKPHANVVIKMAPVQYLPMVKNLVATGYNSTLNLFSDFTGEFDFGVGYSNVDKSLLFDYNLIKESKTNGANTFDYHYPKLIDISSIENTGLFSVGIGISTNIAYNLEAISLANPSFKLKTPYINADFTISTSGHYFKPHTRYSSTNSSYGFIGKFEFDSSGKLNVTGYKDSSCDYPNISVQLN